MTIEQPHNDVSALLITMHHSWHFYTHYLLHHHHIILPHHVVAAALLYIHDAAEATDRHLSEYFSTASLMQSLSSLSSVLHLSFYTWLQSESNLSLLPAKVMEALTNLEACLSTVDLCPTWCDTRSWNWPIKGSGLVIYPDSSAYHTAVYPRF